MQVLMKGVLVIGTVVGLTTAVVLAFLIPFTAIYLPIAWVLQWLLLNLFGLAVKLIPLWIFCWFVALVTTWLVRVSRGAAHDSSTKGPQA